MSAPRTSGALRHAPNWFAPLIRLGLLGLCAVLAATTTVPMGTVPWFAAVALAGAAASLARQRPGIAFAVGIVEAAVTAGAVLYTGGANSPFLAYIPGAAFATGLSVGYPAAVVEAGAAASVLLLGRFLSNVVRDRPRFVAVAAEWSVLALTTGALGGWIRSLITAGFGSGSTADRYAEAYGLLEELRAVTQQLPGTLDPGTVAQNTLRLCVAAAPTTSRGALFVARGAQALTPLAVTGTKRVPWRPSLSETDNPLGQAWREGRPVVETRAPGGRRAGSTLMVVPFGVRARQTGLVALEVLAGGTFGPDDVRAVQRVVTDGALPLETAVLFEELRISAATDERQRLAREMHDGIAQDLAYLGFELDTLTAMVRDLPDQEPVKHARALRTRMTELISDLRLSISDLRSSLGPDRALGAVLAEYARSAGTGSRLTVSLSLTEGTTRLPAETEIQLLRIAHDVIGSVRRKDDARNLWVELRTDPPNVLLRIAHDSDTPVETRLLRERADRIGAELTVVPRSRRGSEVSVSIGGTSET